LRTSPQVSLNFYEVFRVGTITDCRHLESPQASRRPGVACHHRHAILCLQIHLWRARSSTL
jgi:hypothetical protein